MKKITILLVIIFTFLFSTTSWGDWNIGSFNLDEGKLYYDKDRVRKSGKYLYFWELSDFIKPIGGVYFSSTRYTELDCSIFRYKWLKFETYNKSMGEGEKTYSPQPDKWEYPKPQSSSEYMFNIICEEHQ